MYRVSALSSHRTCLVAELDLMVCLPQEGNSHLPDGQINAKPLARQRTAISNVLTITYVYLERITASWMRQPHTDASLETSHVLFKLRACRKRV